MSGQADRLDIQVAWGEQDLFGHVNNVSYFRYMESARMHMMMQLGVERSYREHGIGVILASTRCDFRQALTWPATITVWMAVPKMGTTSFTISYHIRDPAGTLFAEGVSTQVMYDYRTQRKLPVPDGLRAALLALAPKPAP